MSTRPRIRVFIVDDSALFVEAFTMMLRADPEIDVCGSADSAVAVVDRVRDLRPDVVTMDLHMPGVGGLLAIDRIMAACPTPILVMTGDARGRDGSVSMAALARGALDVIEKPALDDRARCAALCERIKAFSRSRVSALAPRPEPARVAPLVVGIGASTGGPQALSRLLGALPADTSAGILVVQHLAERFVGHLARWLTETSKLDVRVARPGDVPRPRLVLLAPDDAHLVVSRELVVELDESPGIEGNRPSATRLFTSLARARPHAALGIVLTGMGRDGAKGLRELRAAGGMTAVQSPASCVVDGMPRAALAEDPKVRACELEELAALIAREARRREAET